MRGRFRERSEGAVMTVTDHGHSTRSMNHAFGSRRLFFRLFCVIADPAPLDHIAHEDRRALPACVICRVDQDLGRTNWAATRQHLTYLTPGVDFWEVHSEFGKLLFVFGIFIAAVGLFLWTGLGKSWLGRLPGDIHVQKGNFNFYFPIVTCLILSFLLTLVLWLFRK